ncbi:MAG: hypothetical protein ACI3Z0_10125 [Candidatus Cryptobacteroides sp.]
MTQRTFKIILATVAIISFVLAVYCIVVSIKGIGGSWALPAALGLTALGNFVNLYSLRKNKRKEE